MIPITYGGAYLKSCKMTNVKSYTNEQILNRIKSDAKGFTHFPNSYFMVFVRSNEDASDKFDDKVYLFKGKTFIEVTSCTTNSGKYGLLNFFRWNKSGTALLKSNQSYYNCWKQGLHKGKMKAWVQRSGKVLVSRDKDKDLKSEDNGHYKKGYYGINIHTVTYKSKNIIKEFIGKWGVGCMVLNNTKTFRQWMKLTENQTYLTSFVLEEW